jgi:hypothetical protein
MMQSIGLNIDLKPNMTINAIKASIFCTKLHIMTKMYNFPFNHDHNFLIILNIN